MADSADEEDSNLNQIKILQAHNLQDELEFANYLLKPTSQIPTDPLPSSTLQGLPF